MKAKRFLKIFVPLSVSLAFAVMNGAVGIINRSVWYGALAAYYILLLLFRVTALLSDGLCTKKYGDDSEMHKRVQIRIYLGCGAFLVIVEIAMCVAVTQMILSESPVKSGEIIAISTAAYAFYKLTMAIINLAKAKKREAPVRQALVNLSFADACMSMVSLTVLLLTTFGGEDAGVLVLAMKACAGFAACAAVTAVAAVMIIKASKLIRRDNYERRKGE